jgi:prepilin-type N-terminal cleavage/methylation domain-containing protein
VTLRRQRPGRGGFTLLEVLLALALAALIAGLWVSGAAGMLRAGQDNDPEDALLALMQRLRREAVTRGVTVELIPLDDDRTFSWGPDPSETLVLPESPEVRVRLVEPDADGLVLLGGLPEALPLGRFRLYPDGTGDRARLEVQRNGRARLVELDPLTCAPLPEATSNR